jgi:acyl carrier protein phosphodiesterase
VLREGLGDVKAHYAQLSDGFHQFFPELIAFVEERRR